ncbi:MAG: hypothetical protein WC747_02310 [Candidatus Babeliales bacterium]|jgi:hypothetical protein
MKKLLLCFALLGASNMSYSMNFVEFSRFASTFSFRDVTGTGDIIVGYPWVPFATNDSISAGFRISPKGIFTGATFKQRTFLVGLSNRAIIAAIVISGGLYVAYKAYCSKKQKSKSDEEESI